MSDPLIQIENLGVSFKVGVSLKGGLSRASRHWGVREVSLTLEKGDAFCLIGESGSGKSTLAQALAGLLPFDEGRLRFQGKEITQSNDAIHKTLIKKAQMVFQDPLQALNPFHTLGRSLEEPLAARGIKANQRKTLLAPLIRETGLSEDLLARRPSQVSGGQNQRVCIARSLSTTPKLLILDEPLTALDSLIKARIIRLLCQIKEKHPLTALIITHDMALVKAIATRVGVIYMGRIVETATRDKLLSAPAHPYTRALLSASFTPGVWQGKRLVLNGDIPSVRALPKGCIFHTRCPECIALCKEQIPQPVQLAPDHRVACHLYEQGRAPC